MPTPQIFPDDAAADLIEQLLTAPGPRLLVVRSDDGGDPRHPVRRHLRALAGDGSVCAPLWHRFDPAPASYQWRVLAQSLHRGGFLAPSDRPAPADPPPDGGAGRDLLQSLRDALLEDRKARVLILDQPRHLLSADTGAGAALAGLWADARARTLPLHLVLLTDEPDVLSAWLEEAEIGPGSVEDVAVAPLGAAGVRRLLPRWTPRDRYLLQAALGGRRDRLRHVDPTAGLADNLSRLVLDPDGPLHREPVAALMAQLRKPDRYVAVLAALARGALEWGEIRSRIPELAGGSRLAPYLAALEEMGWVTSERALDAGPDSRRRRYYLTDPFVGFWLRAVAPVQGRLQLEAPETVWHDAVRGQLEAWAAQLLPRATRWTLEESSFTLGVTARRTGGLWGEGYEVALAGILSNGASFYGVCLWGRRAVLDDASRLEEAMRHTRFGFGRENRLRLVISDEPPTEFLVRQAARRPYLRILQLPDLF